MAIPMGFNQEEWGFPDVCFKRKFRFKFIIGGVSASGVDSLPPLRGARPSISFKEMSAEHLNETIAFPSKPDWKPITLTLYDLARDVENPVFSWLKRAYNPAECAAWYPCLDTPSLKAVCSLQLYDGCGNVLEEWVYEHAWPQNIEFEELEMNSSEAVTCTVTLRYDRAYITTPSTIATLDFETVISDACDAPSCPAVPSTICPSTPAPSLRIVVSPVPEPDFGMF